MPAPRAVRQRRRRPSPFRSSAPHARAPDAHGELGLPSRAPLRPAGQLRTAPPCILPPPGSASPRAAQHSVFWTRTRHEPRARIGSDHVRQAGPRRERPLLRLGRARQARRAVGCAQSAAVWRNVRAVNRQAGPRPATRACRPASGTPPMRPLADCAISRRMACQPSLGSPALRAAAPPGAVTRPWAQAERPALHDAP